MQRRKLLKHYYKHYYKLEMKLIRLHYEHCHMDMKDTNLVRYNKNVSYRLIRRIEKLKHKYKVK